MFNTLSFEVVSGRFMAITPVVDGMSLTALITSYERSKGYLDRVGGYGGLVPAYFDYGPLDEYFSGKNKTKIWATLDGIYLLGCQCGEVGCWPLLASVSEQDDTIIWDRFSHPFRRDRDYSGFGPFQFSRMQYEVALNDLVTCLDSAGV